MYWMHFVLSPARHPEYIHQMATVTYIILQGYADLRLLLQVSWLTVTVGPGNWISVFVVEAALQLSHPHIPTIPHLQFGKRQNHVKTENPDMVNERKSVTVGEHG